MTGGADTASLTPITILSIAKKLFVPRAFTFKILSNGIATVSKTNIGYMII